MNSYITQMDITFMNSKNSKTSNPYMLVVNLWDKINLKRSDKYVALSNYTIYYTQEKQLIQNFINSR